MEVGFFLCVNNILKNTHTKLSLHQYDSEIQGEITKYLTVHSDNSTYPNISNKPVSAFT